MVRCQLLTIIDVCICCMYAVNVVSVFVYMRTDLPEPEKLVNEHLPPAIKVLGVKKATKMFDAKNACSYRTYEYVTPTFAFAPIEEVSVFTI